MQGSQELRDALATACRMLAMQGLIDHAGLVGARIPETGNLLLIPREMRGTQGRNPAMMRGDDFVVVDPDGRRVEGDNNPPSETPIFTGVFAERPDVMCVLHLHLPMATAFSVVGKPLKPVYIFGAPFGEEVPVSQDATLIQKPEQGVALAKTLGDNHAVLLKQHGTVVVARERRGGLRRRHHARRQCDAALSGEPARFAAVHRRRGAERFLNARSGIRRSSRRCGPITT